MTDAFDVSLRVKLDYQAGAAARTATADLNGLSAAAKRLGTAGTGPALARDVGAVVRPASEAVRAISDAATAAVRLGAAIGTISGDGIHTLSTDAVAARRAIAEVAETANRLGTAPGAARMSAELERSARAAAALEAEIDALIASASRDIKPWSPAQAAAAMREFDAQVANGRAQIGGLEAAANRVGTSGGPKALAEGVGHVAAGAAEARREVDELGQAAVRTARDVSGLGGTQHPGGPVGSGGGGGRRDGGGGRGGAHGGGAWRDFERAAAMPFAMERVAALSVTAGGAAGLGLGYGVYAIGHQMEDATRRAIALEDALDQIRRSSSTMSAEGVKALEADMLRTSRATGVATGELAHLGAEASAAGRPVAELPRFMELSAKAATGFGVKVDEIGTRLTRIGADFGLDQGGLERVADATALLQERTGARGAGTLDFVAGAGGAAHLAGMRPEQVAAFGGTMSRLGLAPAEAASTFTGLLEKLESAPMQGGGFKLGLTRIMGPKGAPESPYALRNAMRADPSSGMLRFLEDVKRLPEQRRQLVLTEMFGADEGEKIARMADHLDDFRKSLGIVQDAAARNGAVERVFRAFDDATSKKIDLASAAIEGFATRLGKALAPAAGAAADATARLFDGLNNYVDTSARADTIRGKQDRGEPLTPEERTDLDKNPKVRSMLGLDPDPAATAAKREHDRLGALRSIRDLDKTAKETGDPQIRGMVDDMLRDYRQQYPDQPPPAFARGGPVAGPGGPRDDKVHALLSNGEFVVNAAAAAKHQGLVRAINDDAVPAYAAGGAVGVALGTVPQVSGSGLPDPAALDRLGDAVEKGVKAGVVAGLREARDLPGAAHGGASLVADAMRASAASDGGAGGGGDDGGSGHRSIRYGGGRGPVGGSTGGGRFNGLVRGGNRGRHLATGPVGGGGSGYNAAAGKPGTYRPEYKLSDDDLSDRVVNKIAGEAAAGNQEGIDAVINNVMNRVGSKGWGPSRNLREVLEAPGQYTGYRQAGPQEAELIRTRIRAIAAGKIPDNTKGSNAYRSTAYHGQWTQKHMGDGVVVGNNRFAYEPWAKNGPYAPYNPSAGGEGGSAPMTSGAQRLDVVGNARAKGIGNVDHRLTDVISEASKYLPEGYSAKLFSGFRPGDPRFHGRGMAADISLYDPQGKQLGNYQDPASFRAYEQFAQAAKKVQSQKYPELNQAFRWGGYFSGGRGKYGAVDLMHLDLGGNQIGMGGGSWEKGLTPAQRSLFPGAVSQGMGSLDTFKLPAAGSPTLSDAAPAERAAAERPAFAGAQNPFMASRHLSAPNIADYADKDGMIDEKRYDRDRAHYLSGLRRGHGDIGGFIRSPKAQKALDRFHALDRDRAHPDGSLADPAQRAEMDRLRRRTEPPAPHEVLSPRFVEPRQRDARPSTSATASGPAQGARGPIVQNFYGNHDPHETARAAQRESNREIRRAQARALHGVGRPA